MKIRDFSFKRDPEGYVYVVDKVYGKLEQNELDWVPMWPRACGYVSKKLVTLIHDGNSVLYRLDMVIKALDGTEFNHVALDTTKETRSAFAAEFWDRVKTEIRTIKGGKHGQA